ncbi:hypothetical protein [Deinococcus wulumuqiensis]|uniref:hypothetical protein n=1 Tax=Deinococcus wulumuqiensis TaxID=980427 RepID=UPI00242D4AD4|nr:hypothetical protein [Deinococcus wulumuqiensis]
MSGAIVTSSGDHHRGFHQCPNVLRDKYACKIGVDGYGFVNYLMSWANTDATLSVRRMMGDLGVSQSKLERIQALVLEHCGHFITMTPGDRVNANRWHLDMEQLWGENAVHLAQTYAERMAAKGVAKINTPSRKGGGVVKFDTPGVAEINTRGVVKSDTYKDSVLNTQEKTVVVDPSGENARASQAAPTTLTQVKPAASLSNNNIQASPKTETAQPPVGGASGEAITDEDLAFLFDQGTDREAKSDVTCSENVPPAAAPPAPAAQEAQEGPAAFVPGAESRDEVTGLLLARLGGKSKLRGLLSEPGRDNVRQKASWLDLDPARVRAIVEEAQAKCAAEGVTYVTAITRRLDAALGARDASKLAERPASASTTPGTLGAAYEVKQSVVVAELMGQEPEEREVPRKFAVGARWRSHAGDVVAIEALEGARYRLSNGQKLLAFELTKAYEWTGAP